MMGVFEMLVTVSFFSLMVGVLGVDVERVKLELLSGADVTVQVLLFMVMLVCGS